jgi:primosomal protein N'
MSDLKPCPSCGHQVSEKADTCPSCGRKSLSRNPGVIIVTLLVGITLAAFLVHGVIQSKNDSERLAKELIQVHQYGQSLVTSTP